MRHGHLAQTEVDQVWVSGHIWTVIDDSRGAVHYAPYTGRLGCRLWGLLHGYLWLPVKT
jgi:hypothetical protein